jgi:predicted aconitase
MPGITADPSLDCGRLARIAPTLPSPASDASGGGLGRGRAGRKRSIGRGEIEAFVAAYGATGDKVDVVVFAAPQLSLIEMAAVTEALDGRRVHPATTVLVATSPEIKHAADRMGLTRRIEAAGAIVAAGICFYQSYAGEMAEANGWKRLLTNSAKLVNIIGGYGYRPTLASLERCVDSAVAGRVV